MVSFAYLNLAEDVYPSLSNGTNAMDLIFCRNVLMYFSPQRATKVIHSFHRALVDSGWLFVSAVEASAELFYQFLPEHSADAVLYRKAERPEPQSADSFPRELERWSSARKETASFTPLPVFPTEHLPEPYAPGLLAAEAEELLPPLEEGLALFEQGYYAEAVAKLKGCSELAQTPGISALVARACAMWREPARTLASWQKPANGLRRRSLKTSSTPRCITSGRPFFRNKVISSKRLQLLSALFISNRISSSPNSLWATTPRGKAI